MICFFLFLLKSCLLSETKSLYEALKTRIYTIILTCYDRFLIIMFSFYCNRNCVNVHCEIQSNKGWTFSCHVALGPFLMGCLATYIENCFFSFVRFSLNLFSGLESLIPPWLWMATDAHTPAARIFPSGWDSQVHFKNVWKMSKKDWNTSLLLDPPPMLPKTGFCCLKKLLATRKTHKVLQKQNHWGKDGL